MKKKEGMIMRVVVGVLTKIVSMLYWIMKLFPVNSDKVLCLSRQEDQLSIDFLMFTEELKKRNENVRIQALCCRYGEGNSKIKFAWYLLLSLYHIATSSVCVLDAYWPIISMLNHKDELTIIQMWHAVGKIKKSGYQTLGMKSGRKSDVASLLKMHEQYDYVIAGGKAFNKFYCESFNISEDVLVNIGLPRLDYLLYKEHIIKDKIYKQYPEWKVTNKKIVLYAPTYRRGATMTPDELLEAQHLEEYMFIVKSHPNQILESKRQDVYYCPEFTAFDLLTVCDYVITDYSSIALEAAVLSRKTLYYLYDYEEYVENNGLNLDPMLSMQKCAFREVQPIFDVIDNDKYDEESLERYKEHYLPDQLGYSTERMVDLIIAHMNE